MVVYYNQKINYKTSNKTCYSLKVYSVAINLKPFNENGPIKIKKPMRPILARWTSMFTIIS